jgi:protein-disulfide isomerase
MKKDLVKLSLGLSILAVIISLYGISAGSKKAEFTADDFDRLAEGYAERIQAKEAAKQDQVARKVAPISETDHVKGNREAEITIFEYSDFECPFCKRFYETPAKVVASSNGKVNTVFRHFPLSFHDPLATKEANAAECAAEQGGDEKFFAYHDELFKRTKSNGKGLKESELYKIASDIGLDNNKFKSCLESQKYNQKVQADIASGVKAGITGTPGVIVRNNKTGDVKVLAGAVPIEVVEEAVAELSK